MSLKKSKKIRKMCCAYFLLLFWLTGCSATVEEVILNVSCPPTVVDCACNHENYSDYFTLQLTVATIRIQDDETGETRCIADEDPIEKCEKLDCFIIPNNNFDILFKQGRKIDPSNYLEPDLTDIDRPIRNHTSKPKKRKFMDKIILDSLLSPHYPIELTFPRIIRVEESEERSNQRVRRSKHYRRRPSTDNKKEQAAPLAPLSDLVESPLEPRAPTAQKSGKEKDLIQRHPLGESDDEEDESSHSEEQTSGGYYYGSGACRVPETRNSEITCWKWPNYQSCTQSCIHGYGIETGKGTVKTVSYSCRNSENQWKPVQIKDCKPYLNCKVHLSAPGELKCVEPTNEPAYCDINCEDYEDYQGQGTRHIVCDETNRLADQMPNCARLDDTIRLLSFPFV